MSFRLKHIFFGGLAIILGSLVVSCGTTAHVEKDDSFNFTKLKTYAWVNESEKTLKDRHSNNLVDHNMKVAVGKELQKRGWKETRSNPEVLLDYNIMVENNVKADNSPVYSRSYNRYFYNPVTRRITSFYYPSQMMGYNNTEIPFKEGTITIHMIENRSNKLIWQGWATDEVNSRNLTGKEISSSVRAILKKFNPSQG